MTTSSQSLIPYGRQSINEDDIQAVVEVLRSDYLTQGPAVQRFEQSVASYCGATYAVAANSATSALHVACLALGVGPGDSVWTSPNTFVASANCARYCGATVDFVDIDAQTYNLCPQQLAKKLEQAKQKGILPKVVIPVHFAGLPCDMVAIHELSQQYGFHVIEDASHAIGSRFGVSVTGDCRFSDITIFSFHPVKIITTAEGGLATTGSPALARKMQLLRSHGITREPGELESTNDDPWYYEQQALGFNYRMTDMQAALGASQMSRLQYFVDCRHEIARRYDRLLASLPLVTPHRPPNAYSALHLYPVVLHDTSQRQRVFNRLRAAGISANVHYIPVHTQPYYRALGFKAGDFPCAEAYYAGAISLPLHPGLSIEDQDRVVTSLNEALH